MKKRILVVDDSEAILDVMTLALEAEGYEVSTSLTGACFWHMERDLPDLILLDVLLFLLLFHGIPRPCCG